MHESVLLTHSLLPPKLSSRLFLYAVELEKELHYVSLKLNRVMRKVSALQYWEKWRWESVMQVLTIPNKDLFLYSIIS